MTKKRITHSSELKARVAQKAITGIQTASEMGIRFRVHSPTSERLEARSHKSYV